MATPRRWNLSILHAALIRDMLADWAARLMQPPRVMPPIVPGRPRDFGR